jgi:hypothetical protein
MPALLLSTVPAGAEASDQCGKVFERYQSGVTPQTLTPLRRHSALYVYRKRDGNCGWATVNNVAGDAEARTAGYRKCKGIENNAVVHCTLIGVNGRVLAGAKRFAPEFVAAAAPPPKGRVAHRQVETADCRANQDTSASCDRSGCRA